MKRLTRVDIKTYLKAVGQEIERNRFQLCYCNGRIVTLKKEISETKVKIRGLDLFDDKEENMLKIELNIKCKELADIRKDIKYLSVEQNKLKKALKTQNTILNLKLNQLKIESYEERN